MKVSMDGLRKDLSAKISKLSEIVLEIQNKNGTRNYFEVEDLVNATNEVISAGNILNCVYSEKEEMFTDLSHLRVGPIDDNYEG